MTGAALPRRLTLNVPEGGATTALVVEEEHGLLTLVLPAPGTDAPLPDRCAVTLEFTTGRGLHQLIGTAYRDRRRGIVQFVPQGEVEVLQRRDHVRVEIVAQTTLAPGDPWDPTLRGYTLNASGNGLLVAVPGELEVGQRLRLDLQLPGHLRPVEMLARVARSNDRLKALAIDVIDAADQDVLIRCLFARQRQALKERYGR